jgi:hypothetical protein
VEIVTKRLELLKQVVPGATWVTVLRGPEPQTLLLQAMEGAARSLAMELHLFEVPEPTAFDRAFAEMTSAQVQALFVFGSVLLHPMANGSLTSRFSSICPRSVQRVSQSRRDAS